MEFFLSLQFEVMFAIYVSSRFFLQQLCTFLFGYVLHMSAKPREFDN